MSFYKNKKILVTGGTGLIGKPLVEILIKKKANVTVVSLDSKKSAPKNCKFIRADLRELSNCLKVCKGKDIVFHLAGVKGSPKMTMQKPASFIVPTIMFSFNMMEAARRSNVKRFMFTSSIGVYAPSKIFKEDDVWKTFPSNNDKFAGWAKRICELQAEAYKIQYNLKNFSIVRPANVYGPNDNFGQWSMVVPSLIKKAMENDVLSVWGDGSPIRDLIYAEDVARGMLHMVQHEVNEPVNLASGTGVTIKEVAEIVADIFKKEIKWDTTKPMGDMKRIMSTERAESYGFKPQVSLQKGINKTVEWYLEK